MVVVESIRQPGAAFDNGEIDVGDQLIEVDGVPILARPWEEVVTMLSAGVESVQLTMLRWVVPGDTTAGETSGGGVDEHGGSGSTEDEPLTPTQRRLLSDRQHMTAQWRAWAKERGPGPPSGDEHLHCEDPATDEEGSQDTERTSQATDTDSEGLASWGQGWASDDASEGISSTAPCSMHSTPEWQNMSLAAQCQTLSGDPAATCFSTR